MSSAKKKVSGASKVQELGAWLDGESRMISVTGERPAQVASDDPLDLEREDSEEEGRPDCYWKVGSRTAVLGGQV